MHALGLLERVGPLRLHRTSVRFHQASTARCQDVALSRVDGSLRSICQALTFATGFEKFGRWPLKGANKRVHAWMRAMQQLGKYACSKLDSICAPESECFTQFGLHIFVWTGKSLHYKGSVKPVVLLPKSNRRSKRGGKNIEAGDKRDKRIEFWQVRRC